MQSVDGTLAASAAADSSDTSAVATAAPGDSTKIATPEGEMSTEEFAKKHPFFTVALVNPQYPGEAMVAEENREKVRRWLERTDVIRTIPGDMQFVWSAKPRIMEDGKKFYTLFPVKATPELTGGVIVNARATLDPSFNQPIVTMEMNSDGSRDWARITGANINKRIAIVLDDAVFSAPVVRGKITGGSSQIEGMDNLEEARLLEIVLKAGALPAPVDIIEQRSVGPSLGEDSIRNGILSSVLATLLTILFMAVYYRTGGLVANVAVVFCLLFLLAVLAAFQGTLTLPGIAGIILTLAVAVDANVLIYERIREEAGHRENAARRHRRRLRESLHGDLRLQPHHVHHGRHPVPIRIRPHSGICADTHDRHRRQHVQRDLHHPGHFQHSHGPPRRHRVFRLIDQTGDTVHAAFRQNTHRLHGETADVVYGVRHRYPHRHGVPDDEGH